MIRSVVAEEEVARRGSTEPEPFLPRAQVRPLVAHRSRHATNLPVLRAWSQLKLLLKEFVKVEQFGRRWRTPLAHAKRSVHTEKKVRRASAASSARLRCSSQEVASLLHSFLSSSRRASVACSGFAFCSRWFSTVLKA